MSALRRHAANVVFTMSSLITASLLKAARLEHKKLVRHAYYWTSNGIIEDLNYTLEIILTKMPVMTLGNNFCGSFELCTTTWKTTTPLNRLKPSVHVK